MTRHNPALARKPRPARPRPGKPGRYPATPVPKPFDRFALSRFTAGWTPGLQAEVDRAGGFAAWFTRQLALPERDTWADETYAWWPSLALDAPTLAQRNREMIEPLWKVAYFYGSWTMVRRLASATQVREVMADFWENHLHIPINGEAWCLFRVDYGRTLRSMALGRYADILNAAITHPSMGMYLSNAQSTKTHPNENLGRELLELHTVGREAHTETDVINSARILTGWAVDAWKTWKVEYRPDVHYTGPVTVLDFHDPNSAPDGRALTRRYLDHLARHPATARRLARKLAVRFVADQPSEALVARLAQVYLDNDTAIIPVLQALISSPEFVGAAQAAATGDQVKVRTPDEDVLATYRALGVTVSKPSAEGSAANAMMWQSGDLGSYPYSWPRPDGRPDTADSWATANRFLGSCSIHYSMSGGWWPAKDITYRPYASWLPVPSLRFDQLIDHLSRTLLGRPATPKLIAACCQVIGADSAMTVTADSNTIRYDLPRVLTTVLDTTAHMSR